MTNLTTTRNQHQLEEWGAHCSLTNCNMLDFLPLKCPECELFFCSNHFKPALVASDSNHLCQKLVLKSKTTESDNSNKPTRPNPSGPNTQKCSHGKCKTLMFSPITCRSCQKSYCPRHRLEQDHLCKTSTSSTSSTKPNSSQTNLLLGYPNPIKNYLNKPVNHHKNDSSPKLSHESSQHHLLQNNLTSQFFLKHTLSKIQVNQRNKSELESKQKALEFRIKNGLLTETDKLELQEREEENRRNRLLLSSNNNNNKISTTSNSKNSKNSPSDCCIV